MFCTPCLALFPTHFSQLGLNPANLEATVEIEWILAFLFLRKRHFSMTSQLRHVLSCKYSSTCMRVVNHNWSATKRRLHPQSVADRSSSDGTFYNFSVNSMIHARNYEKSKFVKVTAKILLGSLSSGHGVIWRLLEGRRHRRVSLKTRCHFESRDVRPVRQVRVTTPCSGISVVPLLPFESVRCLTFFYSLFFCLLGLYYLYYYAPAP